MSNLIASCYALFGCYHGEACSFLKEKGGAVDLGGREGLQEGLGGGEEREAAVWMYCMREE